MPSWASHAASPTSGTSASCSTSVPSPSSLSAPQPEVRAVVAAAEAPLAAPSANRSGFVSPTNAGHVLATLDGQVDLVLDAGECEKGVESTILAIRQDGSWEELRPGPVDLDTIRPITSCHQKRLDRFKLCNALCADGRSANQFAQPRNRWRRPWPYARPRDRGPPWRRVDFGKSQLRGPSRRTSRRSSRPR